MTNQLVLELLEVLSHHTKKCGVLIYDPTAHLIIAKCLDQLEARAREIEEMLALQDPQRQLRTTPEKEPTPCPTSRPR